MELYIKVGSRYRLAEPSQVFNAAREAVDSLLHSEATFNSPTQVRQYVWPKLAGREREVFAVMYLRTDHTLIEYEEPFSGTIDAAAVYPREIVKRALELNAAAVIFSHNHPSGNGTFSQSDINLTNRLKEALGTVDIRILDHVLVAGTDTVSMAEQGLI